MTAPQSRSGGLDANARGLIVLVVAVVIGVLLLWKAGDGGASTDTSSDKSSTPNTTAPLDGGSTDGTGGTGSTTSTTAAGSSAHTPGEVAVIVLNGSGKAGVAASTSESIKTKGYTMLEPGNAATNASATAVYFAPGYEGDAKAVAKLLGRPESVVQAKPSTTLGSTTGGASTRATTANVVVVLGADVSSASTGTTTTTSTP